MIHGVAQVFRHTLRGEHAGSTRPVLATGDAGVVKDTIAAIVRRLGVSPRPLQQEVVVPLRPVQPEEREP